MFVHQVEVLPSQAWTTHAVAQQRAASNAFSDHVGKQCVFRHLDVVVRRNSMAPQSQDVIDMHKQDLQHAWDLVKERSIDFICVWFFS